MSTEQKKSQSTVFGESDNFESYLERKADKSVDLSTLGDSFKAKIQGKPEAKQDARGNEAVYISLETDIGLVIQKYGKSLYTTLGEAIKACGGLAKLKSEVHTWKAEKAGRATFNRYYPTPNTTEKKKQ